jgi:hypothetical protein
MTVFLFIRLLLLFLLLLLLLLLVWHGPLTNLQLFRGEIEKKPGMLDKERKENGRRKKNQLTCVLPWLQNGLVFYSLVLQPNKNAESLNRSYASQERVT